MGCSASSLLGPAVSAEGTWTTFFRFFTDSGVPVKTLASSFLGVFLSSVKMTNFPSLFLTEPGFGVQNLEEGV